MGLSVAETKVYLTLVQAGNLSAHSISRISGLARSDIYRVLTKLEKDGLIEKTISRPQQYEAVRIDDCISILLQRRADKTAELSERLNILAEEIKKKTINAPVEESAEFLLLPQKAPIFFKAQRMLDGVQESVCLLGLARRMITWLSSSAPRFENMLARKVSCRMLLPLNEDFEFLEDAVKPFKKYFNFQLRFAANPPLAAFSVWDRKEILLTTSTVDSSTPAPTLWSNNRCLVDLAYTHFDLLWASAQTSPKKI